MTIVRKMKESFSSFYFVSTILNDYSRETILSFIENKDFNLVAEKIHRDVASMILESNELIDDIYWYLDIRENIDIYNYPCIHLAYASSKFLNEIVEEKHGIYLLKTSRELKEGVVINNCPWCGIRLNTSLWDD